jgi:hypothetical protein
MPVNDNFTVGELRNFFGGWLKLFCSEFEIDIKNITIDESIAYDVLSRYVENRQRIKRFNGLHLVITIRFHLQMFFEIGYSFG